jgi:hypothetical protein
VSVRGRLHDAGFPTFVGFERLLLLYSFANLLFGMFQVINACCLPNSDTGILKLLSCFLQWHGQLEQRYLTSWLGG